MQTNRETIFGKDLYITYLSIYLLIEDAGLFPLELVPPRVEVLVGVAREDVRVQFGGRHRCLLCHDLEAILVAVRCGQGNHCVKSPLDYEAMQN